MSKRNLAIIGATLVSLIYGVTFSVAKDVMPQYIQPFGFIVLRVLGATFLFWMVSFFSPKEKMEIILTLLIFPLFYLQDKCLDLLQTIHQRGLLQ